MRESMAPATHAGDRPPLQPMRGISCYSLDLPFSPTTQMLPYPQNPGTTDLFNELMHRGGGSESELLPVFGSRLHSLSFPFACRA